MADRPEMFAATRGFSGMADSMEPCKMLCGRPLLPWQRNLSEARRSSRLPACLFICLYVCPHIPKNHFFFSQIELGDFRRDSPLGCLPNVALRFLIYASRFPKIFLLIAGLVQSDSPGGAATQRSHRVAACW